MKLHDYEILAQRALDGSIREDELRELQDELRRSPEKLRVYRETFLTHELLGEAAAQDPGTTEPLAARLRRQQRRSLAVSLAVAALVLLAVGLALHLTLTRPAKPERYQLALAPGVRHRLEASGTGAPAREFTPGTTLILEAGVVELRDERGVEILVQAPARLGLDSMDRMTFDEGVARFAVPPAAKGFTVASRGLEVIDLGTEFGIVADRVLPPQVHVFSGHVLVRDDGGERDLFENQALERAADGTFKAIPADSLRFFGELPDDLPHVRISFDPAADGSLRLEGSHPAAGGILATAPGWPGLVDGVSGRAARFDGGPTPVVAPWPGIEGSAPRTLAAWVRADDDGSFRQFQTIMGWGRAEYGVPEKCELLLYRDGPGAVTQLRLSFGHFVFNGFTDLADGRWHHVAAVYYGGPKVTGLDFVHLYVDGEREDLEEVAPPDTGLAPVSPRTRIGEPGTIPLTIGHTNAPQTDRNFFGAIDEVHVFEAALPPGRIKDLAATADGKAR